ncbi:MAG: undecaprenyldiphospho-muramoylpentapeptide beta-N-acetylglucosaminyltransferase [Verrucomicrobiota bacterium]
MKFAIAGGGTGGHLFPALAVGEVLRERGHEVLIFISEKEVDALATKGRTDFRFETLPSIGMPKLLSPAMLKFFKQFNASLSPCRQIFAEFKPDAVLGMGGFTSTAPILAGKLRRIPTFVHESNAIPGKANRLNARLVDVVLVGFEECKRHFGRARCEVTGTPIRRSLVHPMAKDKALAEFGLRRGPTTLLVMGGSQGAHGINEAVRQALPKLKGAPLQIIHLTGAQDETAMRTAFQAGSIPNHVAAFCHRMEAAYSAADLVIARSGAASLAEISHFHLPSILIPYPAAAENHQFFNAEIFARAGAATLLNEAETNGEALGLIIRSLAENSGQLSTMASRCGRLSPQDSAARVANIVEGT